MTELAELPACYSLLHFADLDSTNDEAKRRAAAGTPHGLVVWADRQTAGHGRQGRAWQSPAGNLYCSLLLRPDREPASVAQLSFAAALAVCDALPVYLAPRCKWPNDVLVDGRKIAGVLLESEAARSGVSWLVIGIGINIAVHPADTETPATSLAEAGVAATPDAVLVDLCRHFRGWYDTWRDRGFSPVRAAWLDRAHALGGEIRVRYGTAETRGRFVDLDASGALVIENADGRRHNIAAGAVFPAA